MQTLYMPGEASDMVKVMCERVDLPHRAGSYILSMCRMKSVLPGEVVDMVEVARVIKYASEHQEDLKPQFHKVAYVRPTNPFNKPANFVFLK